MFDARGIAAVLGASLIVGCAALAVPTSADEPLTCRLSDGPHDYQAALVGLMNRADALAVAREVLGSQYAMLWVSGRWQGWGVGIAPGALSAEQARAAIVERLQARLSAADAAYLAERLRVLPQPYSEAELRGVQDAIFEQFVAAGLLAGGGISCGLSDAFRVELTVYEATTPEIVARARAIAEPYGDRVRLSFTEGAAPQPASAAPGTATRAAFAVSDHVALPSTRRCVRGAKVRVALRGDRRELSLVTVRIAGRVISLGRRAMARPLTVRLQARRTKITIAVRLRDGRRARRTYSFVRCRRG